MTLNERQRRVVEAIDASKEKIIEISHRIHEHPELGKEEVFASNLLVETLEKFGFQVERGYAGLPTAFRARAGRPSGPRVAFLAEYDALPGLGHACGHNVIATTALGAGIGLACLGDELPGEVWVIGTPAEETDGAKVYMVDGGHFDEVDAALMIHPHEGSYTATHSLALTALQVSFYGRASHAAAAPWDGINALDAVLLTFNNVNAMRQEVTPDVRIHGIITQGGEAPNIIPEFTQARFYLRARQRATLDQVVGRFKACAEAGALASGCRVEFCEYEIGFDDMVNNMTMAELFRDYMVHELGSPPFQPAPESFGSIDMGNVSHAIPAIHALIDIAGGKTLSPHTHEFAKAARSPYADQALIRAGKGLALAGLDLLEKPDLLERVKAEFEREQRRKPPLG
jgi:amidohydrolase